MKKRPLVVVDGKGHMNGDCVKPDQGLSPKTKKEAQEVVGIWGRVSPLFGDQPIMEENRGLVLFFLPKGEKSTM